MPKIIKKLTEAEIRNAKPQAKDYKMHDGEGLVLLVRSSGSKVWQYSFKLAGKENTYTIGKYDPRDASGSIGAAEARRKRDEARVLVKQGMSPTQHKISQQRKQEAFSETSFKAVALEWHSKQSWEKKHAQNILSTLEKDVFPSIGHKQIHEVTRRDIVLILEAIEKKGALDVAKRVCQRCEAVFDYGINKALCEDNPALGRSKFIRSQEVKHRPHLTKEQLPEFLNKLDGYQGRNYIRLAMLLLVFTFVRPGELRGARWNEFDFGNALWRIPAKRMKMKRDHVVPLSKQALEIIQELRDCNKPGDLLFPSVKNSAKPISDVTLTKVLRIMGYVGEKKVVPHGMRHTASTILNENGWNSDAIESQLAHKGQQKIRNVYNHAEYLETRVEMMQWYSDYLDELIT